jgi:hypothetical protein
MAVGHAIEQLESERSTQDQGLQRDRLDLRGQHAVTAYSTLQRISDREYVARVLGVDEFV